MKEKELIDTFGLKQEEISDLVKYLNEHHIKRSFNLFGELVICVKETKPSQLLLRGLLYAF